MPTPVYSIQVRGRDLGGSHRCASKEEAQSIYDQLSAAVTSKQDFFEIALGTTVTTARVANIAGFSMAVHMEETPEERKARAIAQIENQIGYVGEKACYDSPNYANTALIGGGGLRGGRVTEYEMEFMNIEEFLAGRTELAPGKVIMLRYLQEVSDKIEIIPAIKGRSQVKCYFDCGAYKGNEVLTFRVSELNPINIAAQLLLLTSGHHFGFSEAESVLLAGMEKEFTKHKAA